MLSEIEKKLYMAVDINEKISASAKLAKEFLKKNPNSYVALSFGKDSIAVMDLVAKIKPDIDIVWVNRGEGGDTPDTFEMLKHYRNKGLNIIEKNTNASIFEILKKNSINDIIEKKIITKELKKTFREIEQDYSGFFWGLRSDENKKTRGNYAKFRGEIYKRKDNVSICSPILFWTGREIWAYIIQNNLRYNNHYDIIKQKDFDRENARYSNWAGLINLQRGRIWEIQRYYPDLFMKLMEIKPELRSCT